MQKKWPIIFFFPDDFGLRRPVIQKAKRQKEVYLNVSTAARVPTRLDPRGFRNVYLIRPAGRVVAHQKPCKKKRHLLRSGNLIFTCACMHTHQVRTYTYIL